MLKVSLIEILLRGIPEALILTWGIYILCSKKIHIKSYLFSSLSFLISISLIRMLPIDYGVHTSLGIIIVIFITSFINKIPVLKAISATLILMILLSICEWINILILEYILKVDIQKVFAIPLKKNLYGLPSLFLLVFSIFIIQLYTNKRQQSVKSNL